jgi:periplasmic divalent cation tolerance protein
MSAEGGGGVAIILVTAPDAEVGERLGRALVTERLAACVNIVPGVTSLYHWDGEVQRAGEVLLLVKSTVDAFERLRDRVKELHPYDVPEIIDLAVRNGEERYLAWVREGVGSEE